MASERHPALVHGERLDRKTFHARYEAMPEDVRAELIGGVVCVLPRVTAAHGSTHAELVAWLASYSGATLGTEALDNATIILADDSEPQPDACLMVLPEFGGQTRVDADGYVVEAPELVAEVASSSEAYDLYEKRRDYERHGVREYVVLLLREGRVVWLVRGDDGFVELEPGEDGVFRSPFFGGLWLDPAAMMRLDTRRVHEVLQEGLASQDHARFVTQLMKART